MGPSSSVIVSTKGPPLPTIETLTAELGKEPGSVKLVWQKPSYTEDANWIYGVYYGVKEDELFESNYCQQQIFVLCFFQHFYYFTSFLEPALVTPNKTVIVTNLDACETYMFAVGLVDPLGVGPLSRSFKQVTTPMNDLAPPKNIRVGWEKDPLEMKVEWDSSCPLSQADYYVVSNINSNFYVIFIIVCCLCLHVFNP